MIFSEKEVAEGLARLARAEGAKFLRQRLLEVLQGVSSEATNPSAFVFREGRRSLAADLLRELPFDNADERTSSEPGPVELAQRAPGRASVERSASRRRVPAEPE
jgi:hypothetical protein